MRRRLARLTVGLLVLLPTGCTAAASTTKPVALPTGPWSLVALGDSVPSGSACDCTPYPQLSGSDLSSTGGPPVTVWNEAVNGFTTVDVLHQLTANDGVISHVEGASLVEVEVGANDVAQSDACGTDAACYLPKVPQIEANLRSIVRRVHELTAGRVVTVVLLDYWSVWLGGQYARDQGQAYVDAADAVTDKVDTAIRAVAAETKSSYVDLRAAFKGPDYGWDETHYLAPDGDHPNDAGHQKIAAALDAVLRNEA